LQLEKSKQSSENDLLRQQLEECQKQLLSNKKGNRPIRHITDVILSEIMACDLQ